MVDETKPWYYSKTLWVNFIALLALLIQAMSGFVVAPEEQAAIIVVINLILRAITKQGLSVRS